MLSVGGTDFATREPTPLSPKWHSHKHNGPGVRCEIGICMQTGWIVWVNGLHPRGDWSDLAIARSCLIHLLDEGERCLAGGGYRGTNSVAIAPTGNHTCMGRQRAAVRARCETVNTRFKIRGILSQR